MNDGSFEKLVNGTVTPQGMPYCAGYACGYHMIKQYLKKTGKSVVEAALIPASDILKEIDDFW